MVSERYVNHVCRLLALRILILIIDVVVMLKQIELSVTIKRGYTMLILFREDVRTLYREN